MQGLRVLYVEDDRQTALVFHGENLGHREANRGGRLLPGAAAQGIEVKGRPVQAGAGEFQPGESVVFIGDLRASSRAENTLEVARDFVGQSGPSCRAQSARRGFPSGGR